MLVNSQVPYHQANKMYDIKMLPADVLFHILQMPVSSSSLKCLPPHKTLQAVTTSINTIEYKKL